MSRAYSVLSGSFVPTVPVPTLEIVLPLGSGIYRLARVAVYRQSGTAGSTFGFTWYSRPIVASSWEVGGQTGVNAAIAAVLNPDADGRTWYAPGNAMIRVVPSTYGDTWAYEAIVERVG